MKIGVKFKLSGLVYRCEAVLSSILSQDNVDRILIYSKINDCDILRDNALRFIFITKEAQMSIATLSQPNGILCSGNRSITGDSLVSSRNVETNTDSGFNLSSVEDYYDTLEMMEDFHSESNINPRFSRSQENKTSKVSRNISKTTRSEKKKNGGVDYTEQTMHDVDLLEISS